MRTLTSLLVFPILTSCLDGSEREIVADVAPAPAATITTTVKPPFPDAPGDGACRPMADPSMWGCLPAWWLVGESFVPVACDGCGDAGDQVWACEDASHPDDCARLGDAPYAASGFYCCSCTI